MALKVTPSSPHNCLGGGGVVPHIEAKSRHKRAQNVTRRSRMPTASSAMEAQRVIATVCSVCCVVAYVCVKVGAFGYSKRPDS